MYDYGPLSGPSSPYEMLRLGVQLQVGSLSFFWFSWLRPSLVDVMFLVFSWSNFDFIFGMVSLYTSGSLPFHSTLVEAAYAILLSFILHIMDH